jgi:putative FmdB family regulatory protein
MPTYSYRCTECSNAFDIHQSFTDDSLTVCPTCGGVLRKVFSPVGVTFSGSGFYRTDSRAAASGGSSGSGDSAGSGSGDSAPKKDSTAKKESTSPAPAAAPAASSSKG